MMDEASDTPQRARGQDEHARREAFRTRIFFLMLEIAGIFLVPALAGVALGKWLVASRGFDESIIALVLLGTFVFSWVLVIIRYRRVTQEARMRSVSTEQSRG